MSLVACRALTKRYGDVLAVDSVSLDVADGEFVVLVGPSGCGKTTTLRMIAGLESVTEGEIFIGDRLVNKVPPRGRNIAMVFQNYALYPHMRVFDNIAYPLKLRGMPKTDIRTRVTSVADMLGIGRLLQRWPRELSGGERQRVALGRAIVREPQVFLMDEPLSNLDAQLRVNMRQEIIRLQRRLGTTTVYVTHDQVEAMTMGDRIVVMSKGVILQVGVPDDVYRAPVNPFVARFIGSPPMNLMSGVMRRTESGGELGTGLGSAAMPLPGRAVARRHDVGNRELPVQWGIRPEDAHVVSSQEFGPGVYAGTVDLVERLGSDAYASVRIGNEGLLVRTPPDHAPREGASVSVRLDINKLHIFAAETDERIAFDRA